ncbi:UDP-glucose 4-epimerase [compost metagenome]
MMDTPNLPLTPYASDKLAGEHYLNVHRRAHSLEPIIFRFFNIFAPRQEPSSPYSGVISIFSERAQKDLPITIFGDGEQTRDFIYVEDLVKLLAQGIETSLFTPGAVNIGLNQATTLNQTLQTTSKILNKQPTAHFQPARAGDIRHSRADNSRLLQRFIFSDTTPMSVEISKPLSTQTN